MTWARVDDTLHSHPKAVDAGLEAMGLWVLALSYCGAYLTDGHVKRSAAARLAGDCLTALADILVRVRLWEVHPSGDGWQVHDYLDFNPSREQVLAERDAKREGGRRSAAKRWGNSSNGSSDGSSNGTTHGSSHGSSQRGSHASAIGSSDAPDPSRSRPDPDPVPQLALSGEIARAPARAKMARRSGEGSRIPAAAAGDEALATFVRENGIDTSHAEWPRFLNHWRGAAGQRARKADWKATWDNWLDRAQDFAPWPVKTNGPRQPPGAVRLWKEGK
jgi:hypothetical protein